MLWFLSCSTLTVPFEDACETAQNGQCDELNGCPLGTDSTDCDDQCSSQPWPEEIVGACAHDGATLPVDDGSASGVPTNGQGGPVGTWDDTVSVRGASTSNTVERHFRVYVPRRYDESNATPLLFVLGGFTVDMYWLAEFSEANRLADRENLIVVYGHPEWRDFGSDDVFAWYVYNQAFTGEWQDNPDIEYMESILDRLGQLYNIDKSRVYVSGHSRGAALSIIAAFERPDIFAGYCAQAGFVNANDYDMRIQSLSSDTNFRVPGVLVHGESDPDVNVQESDLVTSLLTTAGWEYGEDWLYFKIPNATHEWQSQYNQQVWDFLFAHPNTRVVQ